MYFTLWMAPSLTIDDVLSGESSQIAWWSRRPGGGKGAEGERGHARIYMKYTTHMRFYSQSGGHDLVKRHA